MRKWNGIFEVQPCDDLAAGRSSQRAVVRVVFVQVVDQEVVERVRLLEGHARVGVGNVLQQVDELGVLGIVLVDHLESDRVMS